MRGEGRGEGRGGEREERRGEGGEGTGEEAFLVMWPRRLSALNPPLAVGKLRTLSRKIVALYNFRKL